MSTDFTLIEERLDQAEIVLTHALAEANEVLSHIEGSLKMLHEIERYLPHE